MKTSSKCPHCGKEFEYYKSSYPNGKKHCSRACQSANSRVFVNCPECGIEFWHHKSWPRKYCSRKCSSINNSKKNLGIIDRPPVQVECDNCGIVFDKIAAEVDKTSNNFCSRKCYGEWMSIHRRGTKRPEMSVPRPHLKNRVKKTCAKCGVEFEVKKSQENRRKFCSKDCMVTWQRENAALISGANNFNWRGGYSPYYGENWRRQRRKARKRDNYTCKECGITEKELGRQLDVHHIKPFRCFGIDSYKSANHLDNLICLCNVCHLIKERS